MLGKFETELKNLVASMPGSLRIAHQRDLEVLLESEITNHKRLHEVLHREEINIEVRLAACWALGQLGGSGAAMTLVQTLNAREPELSLEAAKALVSLGEIDFALRILPTLSSGQYPHNRAAAAYTLGMLGNRQAVPGLIDAANSSDSDEVRSHAAEALGHLGDNRAVDALINQLENDPSDEVRFWSAFALGEIGDAKALPQLEKLASTDKDLPNIGRVIGEARNAINRIEERLRESVD